MSASSVWIIVVGADGGIVQTGVSHFSGAAHHRSPEGGRVLTYTADPQVAGDTHLYDFDAHAFVLKDA